ncbi:hypothetical protein CFC21_083096 [Triticum aestivum]|uniref:Protein kinase domain-containing protein n=2 Tax=Triticum aestivum TaxID=4565 RepID=A0A3B6NNS0_WHEAT|nr:hypothetical protein CFC21_083096 [Triticum aestivum]
MAAPPRKRGLTFRTAALALLAVLAVARGQQQYEANAQTNCYGRNGSSVLGYTCNTTAAAAPCATYVVFRSSPPHTIQFCQALLAQNPRHGSRDLVAGNNLTVPICWACPSPAQAAAGVRHLLTYLVTWGDSVSAIADRFRIDTQAVLQANNLTASEIIFPFTTLLIPLKSAPTPDMLVSRAPPPAPAPPQAQQPRASGSEKWIAVGVGVGVGVLALAGLLGLMLLCVRRRRPRPSVGERGRGSKVVLDVPSSADYDALASGKHTSAATMTSSSSSALVSSDARAAVESLTVYKYSELEKATAGFSEDRRVKNASVYRAEINGDAAAVKRVAGDVSGEVGILKRVNHSSLVRLSGFCVHHGDTYLVFELAENGALSDWLHGSGATLVWKQRVQAAFDVTDGLNYLHHYTNPPCVHKNLKSSNVLLDDDLRAKVSSFALARSVPMGADGGDAQLTRHVVGTQGYLAPEYLEHGLITPKLDVFAFGVILLELLSGKEATFDGGDKRGETLLWESSEGLVVDGEDARQGAGVHRPAAERRLPAGPRGPRGVAGGAVHGEGAQRAALHGGGVRDAVGGVQLHAGLGSLGLRQLSLFDRGEIILQSKIT